MKAALLVIDSFGIGALPDAGDYGDEGSNTALHICQNVPVVHLPNLTRLGLGNCSGILGNPLPGVPAQSAPLASCGVMREMSSGKDTTTGHWELAGIILDKPFHTFPAQAPSFPEEILGPFRQTFRLDVLGNKSASGVEIIGRLGEEHARTGHPIIYTSADSVLQVAAHEKIIPLERLYEMCRVLRRLCDPLLVGRVIARPFVGEPGNFERTINRKDFSLPLPQPTIFDLLSEQCVKTIAVGKIGDIFNEQGIDESFHDKGNPACLERTLKILQERDNERESFFMFVNYVDTDMHYGHRRDVQGYYEALAEIDRCLGQMFETLHRGDLLMVTADHGCDPTFGGSDHTREYVPMLAYRKGWPGRNIGIRNSFSDCGQSVAAYFGANPLSHGVSFFL